MKTPKRIQFNVNGFNFKIPFKYLKTRDYYGNKLDTPKINVNQVVAVMIGKQYVKKKYPQLSVRGKSDIYSGGCSSRIYVSNKDGSSVDRPIIDDIKFFMDGFKMGNFNGMYDIYDYKVSSDYIQTDNGTLLEPNVKYIFVENNPMFGSLEWAINEYKLYVNNNTYSDPLQEVSRWITDSVKSKLISTLNL